jgi:hypothetical protein
LKRFIFAIGISFVFLLIAFAGRFLGHTGNERTFIKSNYMSADENYKSAPYGTFKNKSERTNSDGTDYYGDEMQSILDLDYYNRLDLNEDNVLDTDNDSGC